MGANPSQSAKPIADQPCAQCVPILLAYGFSATREITFVVSQWRPRIIAIQIGMRREVRMKLRTSFSLAISLCLAGTSAVFAGSATGSAALALAGVVAAHSPKLSPA